MEKIKSFKIDTNEIVRLIEAGCPLEESEVNWLSRFSREDWVALLANLLQLHIFEKCEQNFEEEYYEDDCPSPDLIYPNC